MTLVVGLRALRQHRSLDVSDNGVARGEVRHRADRIDDAGELPPDRQVAAVCGSAEDTTPDTGVDGVERRGVDANADLRQSRLGPVDLDHLDAARAAGPAYHNGPHLLGHPDDIVALRAHLLEARTSSEGVAMRCPFRETRGEAGLTVSVGTCLHGGRCWAAAQGGGRAFEREVAGGVWDECG
ncbi:hypothetical protein ACGFNY_40900 [Streptomyces chartreusis]|uniref:hypothetical protein n=1 Tax=Streptomyces chartreusis TaxID=1969 RepID=UPI00371F94E2